MAELPKMSLEGRRVFAGRCCVRVVDEACAKGDGKLDSWERWAYASALRELGSCGLVEIERESDRDVVAKMTPKGEAFLSNVLRRRRERKLLAAQAAVQASDG